MPENEVTLDPQDLATPPPQQIPAELPLLPLRTDVVFPHMIAPLVVARQSGIQAVDRVMLSHRIIGVVTQHTPDSEEPKRADLYDVGTACLIAKMLKFPDGTTRLIVRGLMRIRIGEATGVEPFITAKVVPLRDDISGEDMERQAQVRSLKDQFRQLGEMLPQMPNELQLVAMNTEDAGQLADFITSTLSLTTAEKQAVLEEAQVLARLKRVTGYLGRELELAKLSNQIQADVQSSVGKMQREHFLREQMKAIQKELGESSEQESEVNDLRTQLDEAKLPPEARKEADRELERLSHMFPSSSEYSVARTYLDWLIALPWAVATEDHLDVPAAAKVLDEDHYDLDKVKERILEYLAVRRLKADMKGPILCFVGPPGVGKTSLGRSIARALGRKFVRMSLGGVRDEAEIRGHRRTYVGALPGRIIQGIRTAGANNPVFMLDEVDKLGADFRGDPSSALLEVLDPEQNFSFSDHYLDVPFDLSRVIFITTANMLDTVPPALRDRMEVLTLPGYTEEEKISIAERHLIPKQLGEHGLTESQLSFTKDALAAVIRDYTREAGLRNLERSVATMCRKYAREVAEGRRRPRRVQPKDLHDLLGPVQFYSEVAERANKPGVATALAWTPTGGEILFIEASAMRGQKGLALTGSLGDVMKESAQIALSLARAHTKDLRLPDDFYEKTDLHIHVPAGAIPKDGPSAGVAMSMALISLLSNRPTRPRLAMTGEITLSGKVLPVGGVKEKLLAARRAGIAQVILPKRNEKDIVELPEKVRRQLAFHLVSTLDEAVRCAFGPCGCRTGTCHGAKRRKVARVQRRRTAAAT
jgi:ATP-dependent Lon protease